MKKSGIFVFVLCSLIIVFGMFSLGFVKNTASAVLTFVQDVSDEGFFGAFSSFTDNAEKSSAEGLSYHNTLVDINSLLMRAFGTRVIEKADTTVVLTDSLYLANPRPYIEDQSLKTRAEKLKELKAVSEENGAKFLYITAPTKGYSMALPDNVEDFTKSNCNRFFKYLDENSIDHLNLIDAMEKEGYTEEDIFFVTDHHWKSDYAFMAAGMICEYLNITHGFQYDTKVTDISNYSVKTYKDWFLGSQGKKAGRFFTPLGTDDINIILPKFDTHLTESQRAKGTVREGSFGDTVMYMENIEKKDYYNLNPYATYSGGDFREQIITNHLNPDGARVLLIRDSFSCAMSPFLSLALSEVSCIDVREGAYYVGEKINAYDYIKTYKPDFVLVMYTGVSSGDDLFDFGN